MKYDFDQIISRRGTNAIKWERFSEDVLPLWVADTDFAVDPKIIQRLQKRLEHPILGYCHNHPDLINVIVERMSERYKWEITPESVLLLPGVVSGFNFAIRAICESGSSVLFQQPVYPPFFEAPINNRVASSISTLVYNINTNRYEIDFEEFERKIQPETKLFLFCNPQNPTGRVFTVDELEKIALICARHNLVICSDEIHGEIIYSGYQHVPIASLNADVRDRTITLIAPSKTFNIPGLSCSVAIIQNPELRKRYQNVLEGFSSGVSCLSQEAGLAAYAEGTEWLQQMNTYLESNRDYLLQTIATEMPSIQTTEIQATFLAWLDCSQSGIPGNPQAFFENEAKVGLNDGATFGRGFDKFVRLNFGTPRSILMEALQRMSTAMKNL